MKRIKPLYIAVLITVIFIITHHQNVSAQELPAVNKLFADSRPYTRWWWFAAKFTNHDIRTQLDWLKQNNFGGVEVAFIYPVNRNPRADRFEWLGKEWQEKVVFTKHYCDSIGLGCDYTFGTLWPFGGTFVSDEDRTQKWGEPEFKQPLRLSWTHPDTGNVLNHMNKEAFERYADVMGKALMPALKGKISGIFCDSWEVETRNIWTSGFGEKFKKEFGYDLHPWMKNIYTDSVPGQRYDYMKLVADYVLNQFYIPFNSKCRQLGAFSRAQCAGSPTDLITAYSVMDVPESEAMLYNPSYSQIVASAAALGMKTTVSSETFTCLYGWPAKHMFKEQTADLKLVADALFANGVNQIIWHGTPFNPAGIDTIYFYASVHVGKRGSLSQEIPAFNNYLQKVSHWMKQGEPYTNIAVYLPLEDAWTAGEYPPEKQLPWAWGQYELRYEEFPAELDGHQPLWINHHFLKEGMVKDNQLIVNNLKFNLLYIDVNCLDIETLKTILKLAENGLKICLKKDPQQAGYIKNKVFGELLSQLKRLKNVSNQYSKESTGLPLVQGNDVPEFRCRLTVDKAFIFFANPTAKHLTYPIGYGQAFQDTVISKTVTINIFGKSQILKLDFEPYQSILITVDRTGRIAFEDISFEPKVPIKEASKE